MKEIVPDVQTRSVFAPDKGYAFNGYAIGTENGTVLIDPPDPGADGWGTIDLLEPFAGIWLTNRNHSRAAAASRERYGLTVWAHEADADRLKAGADRTLGGGEPGLSATRARAGAGRPRPRAAPAARPCQVDALPSPTSATRARTFEWHSHPESAGVLAIAASLAARAPAVSLTGPLSSCVPDSQSVLTLSHGAVCWA